MYLLRSRTRVHSRPEG